MKNKHFLSIFQYSLCLSKKNIRIEWETICGKLLKHNIVLKYLFNHLKSSNYYTQFNVVIVSSIYKSCL